VKVHVVQPGTKKVEINFLVVTVIVINEFDYSITIYLFRQEFTAKLNLKPGMKVLDIGCGIGGSAFYMARTYQVQNYYYLSLSQTHTHTYARARWLSNALMIKSHFTSLTSYLNDLG